MTGSAIFRSSDQTGATPILFSVIVSLKMIVSPLHRLTMSTTFLQALGCLDYQSGAVFLIQRCKFRKFILCQNKIKDVKILSDMFRLRASWNYNYALLCQKTGRICVVLFWYFSARAVTSGSLNISFLFPCPSGHTPCVLHSFYPATYVLLLSGSTDLFRSGQLQAQSCYMQSSQQAVPVQI